MFGFLVPSSSLGIAVHTFALPLNKKRRLISVCYIKLSGPLSSFRQRACSVFFHLTHLASFRQCSQTSASHNRDFGIRDKVLLSVALGVPIRKDAIVLSALTE